MKKREEIRKKKKKPPQTNRLMSVWKGMEREAEERLLKI